MTVTYWLAACLALLGLAAAIIRAKRNARRQSCKVDSHSASPRTSSDESASQLRAYAGATPAKEKPLEAASKREQPLVLIVDDGNALRMLMAEMLQEEGYAVLQACTGEDAIAKWRSEKPDCVLLDIRLPDMSGIDVLRKMREDRNSAPVALMTAFADADTLAEARNLGIHSLLDKPFDLLNVKQAVRDMAGRVQRREIS